MLRLAKKTNPGLLTKTLISGIVYRYFEKPSKRVLRRKTLQHPNTGYVAGGGGSMEIRCKLELRVSTTPGLAGTCALPLHTSISALKQPNKAR